MMIIDDGKIAPGMRFLREAGKRAGRGGGCAFSGFILAFTVVASAAAPAAAAECHKIFFTTLEVGDCREFGVCDWQVVCAINDQQEVTLVANEEANTNEFISIHQLLTTVQPFPITVDCKVYEHDGGIGANWEDVLAQTRTYSAPGSYSMRANTNEGAVALHFTIDSGSGGVGGTCDAATAAKTYDGIFRPGTGSQGVVYGLTWAELTDSRNLDHLIGPGSKTSRATSRTASAATPASSARGTAGRRCGPGPAGAA